MYRYSMHTGPAVIQTRKIFVHYCARLHAIRYLQAVLSTHHTVVKFITLLTRVYSHTVHGPRLVRTTELARISCARAERPTRTRCSGHGCRVLRRPRTGGAAASAGGAHARCPARDVLGRVVSRRREGRERRGGARCLHGSLTAWRRWEAHAQVGHARVHLVATVRGTERAERTVLVVVLVSLYLKALQVSTTFQRQT